MSLNRRYRFYVLFTSGNEYDAVPLNDTFKIKWKREPNQTFYRREIEADLVFSGDEYNDLLALENSGTECEGTTRIVIYKKCNDGQKLISQGPLVVGRGEWDLDRCICTIPIKFNDDYSAIIDNERYDYELNALDATGNITAGVFNGTVVTQQCFSDFPTRDTDPNNNNSCLSTLDGWTNIMHEVRDIPDPNSWPTYTLWAREEITMGVGELPPGDGWIWIVADDYVRPVSTFFIEETFVDDAGSSYFIEYQVIGQTINNTDLTFDNGKTLQKVIEYVWPALGSPYIISNFFGINADATNPSNDAYDQAAAHYQNCVLWQKSDITNSEASNNASIGMMSFKQLMDMIRDTFNVYWTYVSGILRVEHISYFTVSNGLDLTVEPFLSQIAKKNKYSYEKDEQVIAESFEAMDNGNEDFLGLAILYENDCVTDIPNGSTISHSSGKFAFDLEYLLKYPEDVSLEGYFFGACYESGGNYSFIKMTGLISSIAFFNNSCSFANLHDPLWKWGRYFAQGTMNGTEDTVFESSVRRKQQTEINVILCCEDVALESYDPSDYVKSEMGWGEVAEATFDAKTEVMTYILKHP